MTAKTDIFLIQQSYNYFLLKKYSNFAKFEYSDRAVSY